MNLNFCTLTARGLEQTLDALAADRNARLHDAFAATEHVLLLDDESARCLVRLLAIARDSAVMPYERRAVDDLRRALNESLRQADLIARDILDADDLPGTMTNQDHKESAV
jgi:hypothetical protein